MELTLCCLTGATLARGSWTVLTERQRCLSTRLAMDEHLIEGVQHSPVFGLDINPDREEKRRYRFLHVKKSWNARAKQTGPTKAGYWRTVPVSSEFYWFLVHNLKVEAMKSDDFLLPRFWEWDKGWQAAILRGFCQSNRLPSGRFHALRACFATQLIARGIPATVVMKICGWRDMKTMQRYIRLAGIDEGGATEVLRFIPTEVAVMEKVVSLFGGKDSKDNST